MALRNLFDGNGKRIAPLASTKAALAGTLQPARGAHIKFVIRNDLGSVLGSTVPYQAWDFTVASAKSLAGPGAHDARPWRTSGSTRTTSPRVRHPPTRATSHLRTRSRR